MRREPGPDALYLKSRQSAQDSANNQADLPGELKRDLAEGTGVQKNRGLPIV